jgi:hypothetical protein
MTAPTDDTSGLQTWDRANQLQVWQTAWKFYRGDPPRPLVPKKNEPDDNLILSFGRRLVKTGVKYLFGQPVTSQVTGKSQDGPAQVWLDECWRRNRRDVFLQELAINGGVCGHAFAKILPRTPYPRLIVLDPQLVDVIWADDDVEDVLCFTITNPPVGDIQTRQVIERQDAPDGTPLAWTITDQTIDRGGGAEAVWVTEGVEDWPHDFAPILECQNMVMPNQFWGEPDLGDDVIHILNAINRSASQIHKIMRVHAYPKVWTRGMGAKALKIGIDEIIQLPSDTAELHALEVHADLNGSRAFLDTLVDILCWIASTPKVAFGDPDSLGAVSGVSMQLRFAPLLQQTEEKRLTYGALIVEADRRLLALGKWGDTTITQLQWPELLPSDPLQERQVAVLDDALGVSTQTILEKLGYDPEQEATRKAEEAPPPPALQPGLPGDTGVPTAVPGQPVQVPAPAALQAPVPDIAKTARSR